MAEERKRRRRRKKKPAVDPLEITPGDITELMVLNPIVIFDDAGCTLQKAAELNYEQMTATKRVKAGEKNYKTVPDWDIRNIAIERVMKVHGAYLPEKQDHTVTGNVVFGWDTDSERS